MRLNTVRRYVVNHLVTVLAVLSTVIVIVPLIAILATWFTWSHVVESRLLHQDSCAGGMPGGGMANGIVGSGIVLGSAADGDSGGNCGRCLSC